MPDKIKIDDELKLELVIFGLILVGIFDLNLISIIVQTLWKQIKMNETSQTFVLIQ